MAMFEFPITKLENERFQVIVDLSLYAKESLVAACYKFTDRFYVHQKTSGNNIEVIFELIDQQVRYNTNQQFGHIRDLIVEEAFKPVSV